MYSKLALTVLVVSTFGSVAAVPGKLKVKKNCKDGSKSKKCQLDVASFPDLSVDGVAEIELQLKPNGPYKKCKHVPGAAEGDWFGMDGRISCNFLKNDAKNKDGEVMLYGSIVDEDESIVYQLRPDADGVNEIHATATSDFDDEMDAVIPEPLADEMEQEDWWLRRSLEESLGEQNDDHAERRLQEDGSVLDVLVPWTNKAECLLSGLAEGCTPTATTEQNMRNLIDLAIAETNTAYIDSGVLTSLRLAHAYRTTEYVETGFSSALSHLRGTTDGNMDEVHGKREQYKADIVALIIGATGSCGIGYLGPSKSYMFSATRYSCATGYFSFGHEIGHNLGCNHDRGASGACGSSNYNYGWRDPSANFRSIMAYSCKSGECDNNAGGGCTRVQRFSNTFFDYGGQPIGNSLNDNARRINDVKATVANYFVGPAGPTTPQPTPTTPQPTPSTPAPTPQPTPTTPAPTPQPTPTTTTPQPTPTTPQPTPATPQPTPATPQPTPTSLPSIHNTRCRVNNKCGMCEGNCRANNNRCEPGLYCQVRNGSEPVPGCSGTPRNRRDYCVAL